MMLVHLSDRKHPQKTGWMAKECNIGSEALEMQKQLYVSLNMWYMKHLEVVIRNEAKEESWDLCQMI